MPRKRRGERPGGLIQVSLQIGRNPDGKPIRKYFYGHTRAEAERKREEYRLHREHPYATDITVAEWVEIYKRTYRRNVDVLYLSQDDVPYNRLVNALGRMRMADIRESDLQSALNAVAGMSFSTVDKYAQCIRRVFLKAVKNKVITDNPADDLALPPFTKGTHRALDRWEVELILANWDNEYTCAGLWVLLMLLCGLRRGEMIALDWSAVNLDARTLTVRQAAVISGNQAVVKDRTKTDAGLRTLPICQLLYDALCKVPVKDRRGPVCRNTKGQPLSETSVRRGIQQFCAVLTRIYNGEPAANPVRLSRIEQAERDALHSSPDYVHFEFRCHDLRHTFATAIYDAGVSVKAAQYFLGHADIRMTMDLYTHLSKERDEASRIQMVSLFDSWVGERMARTLPMDALWLPTEPPETP